MVQGSPELLGNLENFGVDGLLVDFRQLAVFHQDFAVDHRRLALAARHAEEHVPVDVRVGKRREGLVVHDDHVRRRPGFQHARLRESGPLGHLGVVLEEHVRHLAPAHAGEAGVVPLDGQGCLNALQHVVGIGVGAQAHQDALFVELEHRGAAHGVAHVAFRVVDAHGVRFFDDVHFRRVHMDAVAQDGLGAQDAVVLEALDRAASVVLEGVIHVVHALGDMDVVAHPASVGGNHPVEGLVGNRKQGVAAEHGF